MRLVIEWDVSQCRSGISATARQLCLSGHGYDQAAALASLHRAVAAWVMGLTVADRLTEALEVRGIRCEEGSAGFVIDLRVA